MYAYLFGHSYACLCSHVYTSVWMCLIYCVCDWAPVRKRIITCLLMSCQVFSSQLCTRFLRAQRPCNIYSILLIYTGLMKYLVPQRTNRTNFLSLPLDLISILISSLCSEYNNATLWCIQRGRLLLNVFLLTSSFQRATFNKAHTSVAAEFTDCLELSLNGISTVSRSSTCILRTRTKM